MNRFIIDTNAVVLTKITSLGPCFENKDLVHPSVPGILYMSNVQRLFAQVQ